MTDAKESCVDTGTVRAVKHGLAIVSMRREHDCGGCKACIFGAKGDIAVSARNPLNAQTGDRVRVDLHKTTGFSLLAILLGLGIPLLLMIVSVVCCSAAGLEAWINLLVSLGVLAIGFGITIVSDRLLRTSRYAAEITEILSPAEPANAACSAKAPDDEKFENRQEEDHGSNYGR